MRVYFCFTRTTLIFKYPRKRAGYYIDCPGKGLYITKDAITFNWSEYYNIRAKGDWQL